MVPAARLPVVAECSIRQLEGGGTVAVVVPESKVAASIVWGKTNSVQKKVLHYALTRNLGSRYAFGLRLLRFSKKGWPCFT